MAQPEPALRHARARRRQHLSELYEFLRIPSISAQPRSAPAVHRCAAWLARRLGRAGLTDARVVPTGRHPIVFGSWTRRPGLPTVLIYGHYDVQPVDPPAAWRSPPFLPTRRGPDLFARGASDDKGPLLAHVQAIESYLRTSRRLPVNVKCLFDGEEEIGSPNLAAFLRRNRRALKADVAVMSDTRFRDQDQPALNYALRGALSLELGVRGPAVDLHSGAFGGGVHNPLQALCEILAGLHDAHGRITIDGLYDRVRTVSDGERRFMRQNGPADGDILAAARAPAGFGEPGFSVYERTTIRPALTINGITGGYQGQGGKAVIPARAAAKLSFRLVPDQDPADIDRLFRAHVARATPPTVRTHVRTLFRARPAVVDRHHWGMAAAADAYRRGFGRKPVYLRSGGTIPVINELERILGIETVPMGFALPDDRMHAPNEKLHLPTYFRAIDTCIWFLDRLRAAAAGARGVRRPRGMARTHRAQLAAAGGG